jgi:hypothetical protein
MTRFRSRRAGGRAGITGFLLFAIPMVAMLFASSASAFNDVNTITGTETWPNVTQSGSVVANRPGTSQVLVAYTDGRGALENPPNFLGLSVSSNNGEVFFRLGQPTPFTGHGTGYGSPILGWDAKRNRWIIGQLSSGCGGKGIGLWYSVNGTTWTVGPCAHNGTKDEKPSMSIDNNPVSPYYGRIYIGFNESLSQGLVTYSNDGVTWTTKPVDAGFLGARPNNLSIASSQSSTGVVWASTLDELGQNTEYAQYHLLWKSTNGGETWEQNPYYTESKVLGGSLCNGERSLGTWRHANFGQLAVGPKGKPLSVYAGRVGTEDAGNIYIASTGGPPKSFPAPGTQWNPSIRIGSNGTVVVTWYDGRVGAGYYQRYQRVSYDEGTTWEPEELLSPAKIPMPTQPNPNLPACFFGDGNVASAGTGLLGYDTWTDGRVLVEGKSVQKVFFRAMSLRALPKAITQSPLVEGSGRVRLVGTVNPRGHETTYTFQYGTTTAYGQTAPQPPIPVGAGVVDQQVAWQVSGFTPGVTYHYRVVASSGEGTTYGADQVFVAK